LPSAPSSFVVIAIAGEHHQYIARPQIADIYLVGSRELDLLG